MNHILFVYGSLMNDEITVALTTKLFRKEKAMLQGYIVSKLKDRKSPGMIKYNSAVAEGFVLFGVDSRSFDTIKAWENTDYSLAKVSVVTESGTTINCETLYGTTPYFKKDGAMKFSEKLLWSGI